MTLTNVSVFRSRNWNEPFKMLSTFQHIFLNMSTLFPPILFAEAYPDAKGRLEDSGDGRLEVPEAVTVEVEDIHPLPEVSFVKQYIVDVYLCFRKSSELRRSSFLLNEKVA